ncbi:leucine-rich repeat receptor protein kinase HPCA1 [Nymphaea colorata]|nr:leucine-rich repeat receptor protein kinase HPCA1 [Nymphaea colorata]
MAEIRWPCFCLLLLRCLLLVAVTADTYPEDAAALTSLMNIWRNTPPSWKRGDPCDAPWEGVGCTGSRVTSLKLSSMGLEGNDISDIGSLTELQVLDLSSNRGLTGPIPSGIGNLVKLTILILAVCNFTGPMPQELGNLEKLTFLALNNNKLTGQIPPSFGKLSNVYWLDFADNMLSGTLPISSGNTPGLDMLLKTKHFHFNRNQLSGTVPESLFRSDMILIHVLFDGNKFSGPIPSTIGLVQTLEVLRLDRNSFSGTVPSLSNLTKINELNLAANQLTGPLPNLTAMKSLNYVDLSNNSFDASVAPSWFTTIQSLTTLVLESGKLEGEVPPGLFSLASLQRVRLKRNQFNGTFSMGTSISTQLQYVDLEYNQISDATIGDSNKNVTLMLAGNPICTSQPSLRICKPTLEDAKPYSTSLANCSNVQCVTPQMLNPSSCECAYPYQGVMHFRAIHFSDLSNATAFQALEQMLWKKLDLVPGSVFVQNPFFDESDYVQLRIALFPSAGMYLTRTQVYTFGFELTNQTFKPPPEFGPYYFEAFPYHFPDENGGKSLPITVVIGIAVGCSVLVLALLALGVYAIRQKRRAKRAMAGSRPFASWGATSGKDSGDAPQLKGARWFSYDEVKKCTDNFSARNEIGSGGYGKVYRGILPTGQMVAIKRAMQGSMQGGVEFKTEIELLSRVHHKNLVGLVGFCFDRGEQMLVYEFVPNGSLKDSLSGKSGIHLDWKRRLRVSLGSARGLAYLHELANPPIIHRDVKSTNILLDESLVAKVADFGLSKLVADTAKGHVSTQVKGTLGYLDPEYYMTQQLTEKSDVYSFGVVMLELVTAKAPIERGKYIVREVRLAIDKRKEPCGLGELLDPAIRTPHGVALAGFEKFVDLAMRCVEESASDRPTMGEIVKEIETILQNEGVNTNPASASSSANDFGTCKAAPPRHPYNDPMPAGKEHQQCSDEFSYSSGYTVSTNIEPK